MTFVIANNQLLDPLAGAARTQFWRYYNELDNDLDKLLLVPQRLDRLTHVERDLAEAILSDPLVQTARGAARAYTLKDRTRAFLVAYASLQTNELDAQCCYKQADHYRRLRHSVMRRFSAEIRGSKPIHAKLQGYDPVRNIASLKHTIATLQTLQDHLDTHANDAIWRSNPIRFAFMWSQQFIAVMEQEITRLRQIASGESTALLYADYSDKPYLDRSYSDSSS